MSDLFHFMTDLAINPKQQQAFAKSPDAVMNTIELSESARAVLKSRDNAQITATFADEHFQAAVFVADPNPDPLPDPDPPGRLNQMNFVPCYA
jgi:hypothetical protein